MCDKGGMIRGEGVCDKGGMIRGEGVCDKGVVYSRCNILA